MITKNSTQLKFYAKSLYEIYFEKDLEYVFINLSQIDERYDYYNILKFPNYIDQWEFVFESLDDGIKGMCEYENRKIIISDLVQTQEEIENILLHELIHFFEDIFSNSSPNDYIFELVHSFLFLTYYEELKMIDEFIINKLIYDQNLDVTVNHTIFFALKSLIIDHQKKLPFGTIYGYERNNSFKEQFTRLNYWKFISE